MTASALSVAASVTGRTRRRTRGRRVLRRFRRDPAAVIAAAVLLMVGLAALLAPWLAPRHPDVQDLLHRYEGFSRSHPLGTDGFGRDVLSRVIFGARTTMVASLEALTIAIVGGAPLGMFAGYFGGKVDAVLNWASDAMMSMPALVVAFTIIAVLGNNITNAMLAVGLVIAPRFFRIARASTKDVMSETYIEASRSIGCSPGRIVTRHVVPNIVSPLVVQASLTLGTCVLVEASLSFLGIGVQPPTASWGSMIATAATGIYTDRWAILAPGLVIIVTVLAFSICGDALRDALAPESRAEAP